MVCLQHPFVCLCVANISNWSVLCQEWRSIKDVVVSYMQNSWSVCGPEVGELPTKEMLMSFCVSGPGKSLCVFPQRGSDLCRFLNLACFVVVLLILLGCLSYWQFTKSTAQGRWWFCGSSALYRWGLPWWHQSWMGKAFLVFLWDCSVHPTELFTYPMQQGSTEEMCHKSEKEAFACLAGYGEWWER